MTLKEILNKLNDIYKEHGDIEVYRLNYEYHPEGYTLASEIDEVDVEVCDEHGDGQHVVYFV